MKTWVKLYSEINRDPALYRLDPMHRLIFFHCLALAGEIDHKDQDGRDTGALGTLEDIAFRIRYEEDQTREAISALIKQGMAYIEEDIVFLTNYTKRQSPAPSETREAWRERKRKLREGQRQDTGQLNDPALPEKVGDERLGELRALLQQRGVEVKSLVEAGLYQQLIKSAGTELFEAAVDDAARASNSGKVTYNFLRGIVERCQREGKHPGEWGPAPPAPQPAAMAMRRDGTPAPTRWHNPITGEDESL
jgi:hypothetical protein